MHSDNIFDGGCRFLLKSRKNQGGGLAYKRPAFSHYSNLKTADCASGIALKYIMRLFRTADDWVVKTFSR